MNLGSDEIAADNAVEQAAAAAALAIQTAARLAGGVSPWISTVLNSTHERACEFDRLLEMLRK